jgi:hypothetical protein
MKTLRLIIATLLIVPFISCSAQPSEKEVKTAAGVNSDKIEAYYFHFTARCVTCNTIEAKTKENLQALYPQQVNNGLITFQSVNLDDAAGKSIANRLGVGGQALLLVKGDEKINITNEGFMYAMVKPDKFKEVINEKVDFLLTK